MRSPAIHGIPSIQKPDWLPDWRDESAYRDFDDCMFFWAWQFLRRNPEYQADYACWAALPWYYPDGGKTPKRCRGFIAGSDIAFYHVDPPAHDGETLEQYEARTGGEARELGGYIEEKWGISDIADPAVADPFSFGSSDEMPPYLVQFAESHPDFGPRDKTIGRAYEHLSNRLMIAPWEESDDPYVHAFAFDLRYGIYDQLAQVKEHLKALKSGDDLFPPVDVEEVRRKGARVESFMNYLRVFDAIWAGATAREIAEVLYPKKPIPPPKHGKQSYIAHHVETEAVRYARAAEQWVYDCRDKACDLVFNGYREMMRWAILPKAKK